MEKTKEKIAFYKEYVKFLMLMIITIMSGIVINLFNVFIKKGAFLFAFVFFLWYYNFVSFVDVNEKISFIY